MTSFFAPIATKIRINCKRFNNYSSMGIQSLKGILKACKALKALKTSAKCAKNRVVREMCESRILIEKCL